MSICLATLTLVGVMVSAADPAVSPTLLRKGDDVARKGVEFLRSAQNETGTFGEGDYIPAMTALALTAMMEGGKLPPTEPAIAKGLKALEAFVQEDGGIYPAGSNNRNYPTAIAVLAFRAANREGKYDQVIQRAAEYLKKDQWDEGEGITPENPKYGGAGYGAKSRPDLSNTTYFLEALEAAGVPKDDPSYQRALTFISRCQNLSGEGNDLPQAGLVDDGGFYYTPAEDYNPGGKVENGGLRSYASMTYAGLKSFIHAGLSRDDKRVQAAYAWIQKHYTLEENPGLGKMGLFYYYHTFAKALGTLGIDRFESADGSKHDWRSDLVDTLASKQRDDGSFVNEEKRWMESDPRLVTSYSLLALAHALKN